MIPYAKPHLPNVFQGILMRKCIFLFGLRRELPTASSGYGDFGVGTPVQPLDQVRQLSTDLWQAKR